MKISNQPHPAIFLQRLGVSFPSSDHRLSPVLHHTVIQKKAAVAFQILANFVLDFCPCYALEARMVFDVFVIDPCEVQLLRTTIRLEVPGANPPAKATGRVKEAVDDQVRLSVRFSWSAELDELVSDYPWDSGFSGSAWFLRGLALRPASLELRIRFAARVLGWPLSRMAVGLLPSVTGVGGVGFSASRLSWGLPTLGRSPKVDHIALVGRDDHPVEAGQWSVVRLWHSKRLS
jgi:hypothetical protein